MDTTSKTQAIDRLKSAQNILITVSSNPSVDQLSAAIGAALLLTKAGKSATAVFSGQMPSTIEFLKPEETFEKNTDSLRDFIISLDKSKADKLRYKVEDNVVKIFITPYKTSLSSADLVFGEGDFNVDAVLALGVDQKEHLDNAVMTQSRILHDATLIGFMAGKLAIDTGSINWQDEKASSLSEMVASIADSFGSNLLDSQIATAFLTGIVAETERFSNEKTTPQVMSLSAILMSAGANQQLISTELSEGEEETPSDLPKPDEEGLLALPEVKTEVQPPEEAPIPTLVLPPTPPPTPPPTQQFMMPAPMQSDAQALADKNRLDQINIDEQGNFVSAEDQASGDVPLTQAQNMPDHHDKTIQPPAHPSPEVFTKYVEQAPMSGGKLTANTVPEALDPSTDPLSGTLPSTAPGIVGGNADATLQQSVNPEVARQAVIDAVNSVVPSQPAQPLVPLQNIGAQILDEIPHPTDQIDNSSTEQNAPPMVPPPLPLPNQQL